jgi:myo-inositol-1(or 4)-monophosphatase
VRRFGKGNPVTAVSLDRAMRDIEVFLAEAGALALSCQSGAASYLKSDRSLVTETDLAISQLARQHLAAYVVEPDTILIDEETIDTIGPPAKVFAGTDYQWVLDPIDGTSSYALGRDGFGIYLALLHRGRPLLAGCNLPAKDILLLADAREAYLICRGARSTLAPRTPPPFSPQHFLEVDGYFEIAQFLQAKGHGWITSGESSASQFANLILGRVSGTLARTWTSLWDIAVPLTIGLRLGICFRFMDSDQDLVSFDAMNLTETWKIRSGIYAAYRSNIEEFREILSGEASLRKKM